MIDLFSANVKAITLKVLFNDNRSVFNQEDLLLDQQKKGLCVFVCVQWEGELYPSLHQQELQL